MDIKDFFKKSFAMATIAVAMLPTSVLADDIIIESKEPDIEFFNMYVGDLESNNTHHADSDDSYNDSNIIINNHNNIVHDDTPNYVPVKGLCMYATVFSNIYSTDKSDADIVTQIREGEFLQVVGEDITGNSFFYQVKYNGKEGYIAKSNVTSERYFKPSEREVFAKKDIDLYSDKELKQKKEIVKKGTKIKLSAESADIFETTINDEKFYFLGEFTTGNKVFKEVEEDKKDEKVKITDKNNSLLLEPNENSEVILVVNKDEKLEKLEENSEWVKVKTENDEVGYLKVEEIPALDVAKASKIGGGSYASVTGQQVVDEALKYVGNKYVSGGNSLTNGTDCSGFTKLIYAKFGYNLPRYSGDQRYSGTGVTLAEARPGDLICYPGHVAIYMGNNRIVHASTPENGIKTGTVYIGKRIIGVRRILK